MTTNASSPDEYWLLDEHVKPSSSSPSVSSVPPVDVPVVLPLAPCGCICYGTGRFLRSVFIPIWNAASVSSSSSSSSSQLQYYSSNVVCCIQPRGTSFISYMKERNAVDDDDDARRGTYEVDVVLHDGSIQTEQIGCRGVFTMKTIQDHMWPLFFPSPPSVRKDDDGDGDDVATTTTTTFSSPSSTTPFPVRVIAIGVTEAGLVSPTTSAMQDVYALLHYLALQYHQHYRKVNDNNDDDETKICILNTDNVPNNGTVIEQHMRTIATSSSNDNTTKMMMLDFLQHHVVFINSMVDRIVSSRPGNPNVPRTEPIPAKAMVLLDVQHQLPSEMYQLLLTQKAKESTLGLVIRNTVEEYQHDLQYKLCIANGTHTAIAHTMALLSYPQTDLLSKVTTITATAVKVNDKEDEERIGTNLHSPQQQHHAKLLMDYLQEMVHDQIIPALMLSATDTTTKTTTSNTIKEDMLLVWKDWYQRLLHGHFGLSTFFITQNGAAKGGIRFTPTILPLLQRQHTINSNNPHQTTISSMPVKSGLSVTMVYAYAALLRWLTPIRGGDGDPSVDDDTDNTIYIGWLDGFTKTNIDWNTIQNNSQDTITYADQLRYNLQQGWYEFKCACYIPIEGNTTMATTRTKSVASWLAEYSTLPQQPSAYIPIVRAYMISTSGGNCPTTVTDWNEFDTFVSAIATIYARMIVGDGMMTILEELLNKKTETIATPDLSIENDGEGEITTDACHYVDTNPKLYPLIQEGMPLHYRWNPIPDHSGIMQLPIIGMTNSDQQSVDDLIVSEVASTLVIDIHTHLLPPTHGPLCLWGIDELLTYHYLVAEYFITAPTDVTPESFYIQSKQEQADLIWKALFVDRMPLSEATRGVVTTLNALGLAELVNARDLSSIRKFYDKYRDDGVRGAERYSRLIHERSGVRYNIMTNIPFDMNEAQYWRPNQTTYSKNYRSALRIDPLLTGDIEQISKILRSSGYEPTIDGACQYLRDWCDIIKPEYMMASTPHNFDATSKFDVGINRDAMKIPGAFAVVLGSDQTKNCSGNDDDYPSVINEHSDFLSDAIMRVCEERDLPIALKIGAHRGLNPRLKQAGDGVVAFADTAMLTRLCTNFPRVRFLVTFLSRNNQHEACVLASKFPNLHLYGCWWYCFTPSIVKELTQMRIEMLGTAFTAQHSDARVLDQLIYKWGHSRNIIATVVSVEINKLLLTGWKPSRSDLRKEVDRLFGGSYEEFMMKSFIR